MPLSKDGLAEITKPLAAALSADNIQSYAILPGLIDTDTGALARQQAAGLIESQLRGAKCRRAVAFTLFPE